MRITNQGFRRVTTEQDFEAKQNASLKYGSLVLGAVAGIVGSITMFTVTPAIGQVEGNSFPTTTVGGKSEGELLNEFKLWACNVRPDPSLCDKYKDTSDLDDIIIDDLIEWKTANEIVDLVDGDMSLFGSIEVRYIVEQRAASSSIGFSSSVNPEIEFSRQASASIELRFDGGSANWESPVNWENMDVYWDAPEASTTPFLAKIIERNVSSLVKMNASVGTADFESTTFWEFMDVDWDEEDTSSASQFTAKVFERTTSANITTVVTVGTAGWASNIEWQNADVEWSEYVAGSILQGNASASISISVNTVNINLIEDWSGETSHWSQKTNNWEAS